MEFSLCKWVYNWMKRYVHGKHYDNVWILSPINTWCINAFTRSHLDTMSSVRLITDGFTGYFAGVLRLRILNQQVLALITSQVWVRLPKRDFVTNVKGFKIVNNEAIGAWL